MKETNSVPAWEEEAKPDEVLVQTSTGLFKFQGMFQRFRMIPPIILIAFDHRDKQWLRILNAHTGMYYLIVHSSFKKLINTTDQRQWLFSLPQLDSIAHHQLVKIKKIEYNIN